MTLIITFGFLFIIGLLLTPLMDPDLVVVEHYAGFTFTLLIGGFILSSMAFRDLHNNLKRYTYLTLPASTVEKFISMWLLTSVGWILLYLVFFTIYVPFANSIGQIVFHDLTFLPFNPFGQPVIKAIRFYFVLQGIFLAGAVHFKGYPFPKTLLALVLFGAVCSVIFYLIMKDMFEMELNSDLTVFMDKPVYKLYTALQWMFWWLLAPLCWVITYLGLKEQEV